MKSHQKSLIIIITTLLIGINILSSPWGVANTSFLQIYNGNTLYVGGIGPGNYTRIQDAIDNASDGDTVFVYDDSSPYKESVMIDKTINLIGEDRNTAIIETGGKKGSPVSISSDTDNIVISGFTIRNGWNGIYINSDNNIIQNNKIVYCHTGININSDADYNTITNNIIIHNEGAGIFDSGRYLGSTVTWNVIGGNGKYYPYTAGLYKHFSGGNYHHNDFVINWKTNAYTSFSYWGIWNDSSEGNFWYNWEDNPGYPDTYIISGSETDQIDYHPSPTPYFNYTIVVIDAGYIAEVNSSIWFRPRISVDPSSVSWFWDFGDGTTSNEMEPVHLYSKPGTFDISVTVTDSKGQSDTDKSKAYIGEPPHTPSIEGPTICKRGKWHNYTIVADDPDGGLLYYDIDWGDGVEENIGPYPAGEEVTTRHRWEYTYTYTVRVKAIDEAGFESDWEYLTVQVTRDKAITNVLFNRFLEQFPLLERLLSCFNLFD